MGKLLLVLGFAFTGAMAAADTFEIGWDRPGFDYYNYAMPNPREILCQWKCQQDSRCRAWTFVNPGVQGPQARCWLKNKIPAAVKNSNCTSGIIQ